MPAYHPGKGFRPRSRKFGIQKHPITGKTTGHKGDDWPATSGTPIPAAYDGEVQVVAFQYDPKKGTGWGWYVVLEHRLGGKKVQTRYAHMRERSHLAAGAKVKKGDVIGLVGSTGRSTGPHLHFEVLVEGKHVSPDSFDFPGAAIPEAAGDWAYPFALQQKQEPLRPGHYLGEYGGVAGAIARADDGFYPIGANGLWHGGIHFGAGTGTLLDQSKGVRCIKSGEVVAYKLDRKYQEVLFPNGRRAAYSSGFTLVRHVLEHPESNTVKTSSKDPGKPNRLVFYSLYMHVLDWVGYEARSDLARPTYWDEPKIYRVGEQAKDCQERLQIQRQEIKLEPALDIRDLSAAGMCDGDADDHDHALCLFELEAAEEEYP